MSIKCAKSRYATLYVAYVFAFFKYNRNQGRDDRILFLPDDTSFFNEGLNRLNEMIEMIF